MNAAINIQRLSCSIGSQKILLDVSFSVRKGEFLSIIGPNGAGKSTLLKCINRVLPLSAGSVIINGQSIGRLSQKELARQISYVPQFSHTSLPYRVNEFLLMNRYAYSSPFQPAQSADHQAVRDALRAVKMESFAERLLSTLSGGERQKILVAAALVQDSPIMMLDEPITFLDPKYQKEIMQLLRKLNKDYQRTILAVSHDINSAVLSADRVLALKNGRKVCCCSGEEIMDPERLKAIFDLGFVFVKHPHADIRVIVPEHL